MSTVERRGKILQVNTHSMSGKPRDVPFDEEYTQSVDSQRQAFLLDTLSKIYPKNNITIIGAPWDYKLAEPSTLYEGTPIGNYRVRIGEDEHIVCVNLYHHPEAIAWGGEIFAEYKNARIDTLGPVSFPDGQWTQEAQHNGKTYAISLEEFPPGVKTLFDKSVSLPLVENPGLLLGRMYNAAEEAPDDLKERWKDFSDKVSIHAIQTALEMFNEGEGIQELKSLVLKKGAEKGVDAAKIDKMFNEIAQIVQNEIPIILTDNRRTGTSMNMIEKMVFVNPDNSLGFKSHHTMARGWLPMLTKNATYDMGFALTRIFTNPDLYKEKNKDWQMQNGIQNVIEAYNYMTGLELTFNEAVSAAKRLAAFQMLWGVGYEKLAGGHQHTTEDLVNHIVDQVDVYDRIQKLEDLIP